MIKANRRPVPGEVFLEAPELDGAFGAAIQVERVLLDTKTEFQELQVIEAGKLGRMLILDGIIQTSDFDETAYHEMIAHVPLLVHPKPERVLIIGGGDGGTAREAAKHKSVKEIDQCEIDEGVIKAARAFLPQLAAGYDSPKVKVHLADGAKFVEERPGHYDVIIVDSSDPVGPAVVLFRKAFFSACKKALRPGGVMVTQAESFYLYGSLISGMFEFLTELFERPLYYTTRVPTYPSGIIGFTFCSLGPDPFKMPDPERVAELGELQYYTPAVGRSSFALPQRALNLLPTEIARIQAEL